MSMLFCKKKPYFRKRTTFCLARSAEGKVWCDVTRGGGARLPRRPRTNAMPMATGEVRHSPVLAAVLAAAIRIHTSVHIRKRS